MNEKIGRNDPCPCNSGKKYKSCCMLKKKLSKHKITAKWLNAPKVPNLMERAFGQIVASTEKVYTPIEKKPEESDEGLSKDADQS